MDVAERVRVLMFGPPTVHLLRWSKLAEEGGFATELIAYDHPHPDAIAHVAALPGGRLVLLRALLRSARQLRKIVLKTKPDVVHAHWLTGPGWIAALAGSRPLVVTAWGSDALRWTPASRSGRLLTRLVARRAAAITYDAESVARSLLAAGAKRDQLVRIVIGADDERFGPRPPDRELLDRLGVPRDRRVVLSGRGLDPVYRQDVVVAAFARLARERPATLLLRAQSGDGRLAALLALAAQHGVADFVVPYDGVADNELPRLLASVDAAVSVPESDGTSVLLLECLLCGTPVVVSDLAANREWVQPSGWIVPAGDAQALATALALVLDDPAGARRAVSTAAARVRAEGTQRRQREQMAELYARLAAASRTAPTRV